MLIVYNNEDIGLLWGPSLNRALIELHAASGVVPIVRSPYGGKRTPPQQQEINPGQYVSDHVIGRAVDIWNWEQIQARIGVAEFKRILRKWGWLNQQVNGDPFGSEPWHYANHLSSLALAGLAVKLLVTKKPKPIYQEDLEMVPRTYTTDNGKTFRIMGEGWDKPLVGVDGKPATSQQVQALNQFLTREAYYPYGNKGAAVLPPATAAFFRLALTPPAS